MITRIKMLKDIQTRSDIEQLMLNFYGKVRQDKTIGFIFNDVVDMDWPHHIPVIVDFWETILLDNPVYKNNAMEVHYNVNKKVALQKEHFESWLYLFTSTVDEMFEGKIANLAKTRAKGIADMMLLKISSLNNRSIL